MNLNGGSVLAAAVACSLLIGAGAVSAGTRAGLKSVGEIEAEIAAITDPTDQDRLASIFVQLANREDIQERENLQRHLDERLQTLWAKASGVDVPKKAVTEPMPPVTEEPVVMTVDPEILKLEIEGMRVGPEATVEDARRRDELFAQIAQVADPDTRDALVDLFQQHER